MKSFLLITGLGIGCAAKQTQTLENTEPKTSETKKDTTIPRTMNPPVPEVPKPTVEKKKTPELLGTLPKWEDLNPPEKMPNPTPGLGLSHDHKICFKEWFGDRTVHPHVRKHGGRILKEGEEPQGQMIQCPEERKQSLLDALKAAGAI